MINKALKAETIKRLGISESQYYRELDRIRSEYKKPGMKNELAAYLLALETGIKAHQQKWKEDPAIIEEAEKISKPVQTQPTAGSPQPGSKTVRVKKPPSEKFGDIPPLTPTEVGSADQMADVYYKFYLIENSLRKLIIKVLKKHYGENWWDDPNVVVPNIQNTAKNNKEDEKKKGVPWHGRRGKNVHQIYYIHFGQLGEIISKNWRKFKDIIDEDFFKVMMKDLGLSRIILMHCNPLSAQDVRSLNYYFEKWQLTLKNKSDEIPK